MKRDSVSSAAIFLIIGEIFLLLKRVHHLEGMLNDNPHRQIVFSLTPSELLVLNVITRKTLTCPDGIPLKEISEELGINKATTSALVSRLMKKNVVVSQENPANRRARQIIITPETKDIFAEIHQYLEGVLNKVQQTDKKLDFDELSSSLLKIHGVLREFRQDLQEKNFVKNS